MRQPEKALVGTCGGYYKGVLTIWYTLTTMRI